MSDRERARKLAHWLRSSTCGGHGPDDHLHDLNCNVVTDKAEAALRSAREEERARCIQAVWAVKDRRGVVCREEVDLCRDIHSAIESGSERAGGGDNPE